MYVSIESKQSRRPMKIFRFLFLLILIPICLSAQDHHSWSYNLSIYEVNVRQYTTSGTFNEFETHLNRLKDLGVGIIWFMPIHPIGVKNRLYSLGSYYSVKDYYGVNPEFGTLADFKALVDSIHAKGMYVLMDWVANHTSWDNSLTVSHPEWYVHDSKGNFTSPPGTGWTDVIQLDYSQQGLRDYMINAMKYWINEANIDGFRCDAASFVPSSFWSSATTELKKVKPGLFMLAEDDNTKYPALGFDMTYAWGYHGFGSGILNKIVAGTNNANTLYNYVTQENYTYPASFYRMYFTSNHDENSWYGTNFEEFGGAAEEFAALTTTFRSMPLIYGGEEAGLNKRLKFFDKDQIPWQSSPFASIYSTLLHLKRENKALWNGADGGQLLRVTTTKDQSIFAFIREKENYRVFEIFNLTNQSQTFTLQGSSFNGYYRDVFAKDSIYFSGDTEVTLPAWGYKIYEYGSGLTEVAKDKTPPTDYALFQNYPNPFNPTTTIKFFIPGVETRHASSLQRVTLKVYDTLGREIATLVNGNISPGNYEAKFDGAGLSSGIYFYRLTVSDKFAQTKKMILMK